MAAFLAGRGSLSAWGVLVIAWTGNVSAAIAVYVLAQRYGRPWVLKRAKGTRLLEQRLTQIETAYQRHGMYAIFLMRLLPFWRGVVPPSAALGGVPLRRAFLPIALASAVWYGALVFLVATFGKEFDAVRHVLAHVNRLLVGIAIALLVGIVLFIVRRRSRT